MFLSQFIQRISLENRILVVIALATFFASAPSSQAFGQTHQDLLKSRIGHWTAEIRQGDQVVGTRSMTIEPILKGHFHSCRFVDQVGEQSIRGWQIVKLDADGLPVVAKVYDSLGRNDSCSVSFDGGQLTLKAPDRTYQETIGTDGPTDAAVTASGTVWTLTNFRKTTVRVTQQADSPPEANSPMAVFAPRIGTWHGDVLFLGRKVFEVEYSWSWDLNGRIHVQHRKAGGELVVDTWNSTENAYESTVFTVNGEIQIRKLTENESSRDVVLDKADDLGVIRITESLNTTGDSFVRGVRENGSTVWDCPKMVRVSPIPLHLDAEVGAHESLSIPDWINFRESVKYNENGPVDLFLDFACPKDSEDAMPCVVLLHGGAWRAGDKSDVRPTLIQLAQAGYAVAAVQYRLCPEHRFPCQVHDVKCAVRYLRANAKQLGVDANRFAAVGYSAGGHLALMLGLTSPADGLEGDGGWSQHSSEIQAAVSYFGPTSFVSDTDGDGGLTEAEQLDHPLLVDFIDADSDDEKRTQLRLASPVAYVDAHDAPVLLFHGKEDGLVPVEQAHVLTKVLSKAMVPHRLLVGDYNHGWMPEPEQQKTDKALLDFLRERLQPTQSTSP